MQGRRGHTTHAQWTTAHAPPAVDGQHAFWYSLVEDLKDPLREGSAAWARVYIRSCRAGCSQPEATAVARSTWRTAKEAGRNSSDCRSEGIRRTIHRRGPDPRKPSGQVRDDGVTMSENRTLRLICLTLLLLAETIQGLTPDLASVASTRLLQMIAPRPGRGGSWIACFVGDCRVAIHTEAEPAPADPVPWQDSEPDEVCIASFPRASQLAGEKRPAMPAPWRVSRPPPSAHRSSQAGSP